MSAGPVPAAAASSRRHAARDGRGGVPYTGEVHDPSAPVKLAAFPRDRLIERELFAGTVNEVDLLAALGAPSGESVPALGAGHPTFFWDLTYGCGLVMGLQFDQLTQRLTGFLDAPDVEHALRHLGVPMTDRWLLEASDPDLFRAVASPTDARCGVAAIVDGRRRTLAEGLTERDARCRCASAPGEPATGGGGSKGVSSRGREHPATATATTRPMAPAAARVFTRPVCPAHGGGALSWGGVHFRCRGQTGPRPSDRAIPRPGAHHSVRRGHRVRRRAA